MDPLPTPTVDEGPPTAVRYVVVGIVAATLLAFASIAGALYAFYGDTTQALGVGLFASFWGGPGFGLIGGIAVHDLAVQRYHRES
jgi:hypothetical protein